MPPVPTPLTTASTQPPGNLRDDLLRRLLPVRLGIIRVGELERQVTAAGGRLALRAREGAEDSRPCGGEKTTRPP